MTGPISHRSSVRFGLFELDLQTGELRKNGLKLKLQEQPLQVLTALLSLHETDSGRAALAKVDIERFERPDTTAYDTVRNMAARHREREAP